LHSCSSPIVGQIWAKLGKQILLCSSSSSPPLSYFIIYDLFDHFVLVADNYAPPGLALGHRP